MNKLGGTSSSNKPMLPRTWQELATDIENIKTRLEETPDVKNVPPDQTPDTAALIQEMERWLQRLRGTPLAQSISMSWGKDLS